MLKQTKLAIALAAATVGLTSLPAQALDWNGYFRAGPATTKKDSGRACYGIGGEGLQYRLGNECDFYGEFALSQGFKADAVDYKATFMTNIYENNTNGDTAKLGVNQMFLEGKGYDIAPNATFWIGKRFYGRFDVHIVDTFYSNLSGTGGGVYDIQAGPGKFGIAYFKTDTAFDSESANASRINGNRINLEYYDLQTNPGGKLKFVGTYTEGNFNSVAGDTTDATKGKDGWALSAMHQQENFLGIGGNNTVWLQYAQGSAGLNSNFAGLTDPSDKKSWRIVDGMTWQVGAFGGMAQVLFQQDKVPNGLGGTVKQDSWTIGGRGSYAITKNFKLVAELGHSEVKPEGGERAKMTKFTFAPTLSTGPDFWNRPELRLYVTTAKWNEAARSFDAKNTLNQPAFAGNTSGTSFGLQVEAWF